jgi:Protein of unknown function (DUF2934)
MSSFEPTASPQDQPTALSTRPGPHSTGNADAARRRMIAEAAYRLSERRGFEPGHELEDWLAAENEIVKSWLQEDASKS